MVGELLSFVRLLCGVREWCAAQCLRVPRIIADSWYVSLGAQFSSLFCVDGLSRAFEAPSLLHELS